MVWWGWIAIGLLLMGAELVAVDAAFYLVFVGSAAIITGLLGFIGLGMSVWLQWLVFGVLAAVTMVLFRKSLYSKLRREPIGFADQVDGRHVAILEDVAPGGETRVEFRGSRWSAINISDSTLRAGEQAIIVTADGSRLEIDRITAG